MTSFIAVLIDPLALVPKTLPVAAGDCDAAVAHVRKVQPYLSLHSLFDLATLVVWDGQLHDIRDDTPRIPLIAIMRHPEKGPFAFPLLAVSMDIAEAYVTEQHPESALSGLYDHDALRLWLRQVQAFERSLTEESSAVSTT